MMKNRICYIVGAGDNCGLDNATLTSTFPIGVSNEFIGKESTITVETGTLLVVFPREIKEDILI